MNKLSFFIAWRYLWYSAYENNISAMIRICFISILIGTFSLGLVTAIMHGFEIVIHEKMQGIHAQATIQGHGQALNIKAISTVLNNEFPSVAAFSPSITEHALVHTEDKEAPLTVVILKGIDPTQEAQVSRLQDKIVRLPGTPSTLQESIHDNRILIGKALAENLGVKLGDEIDLFYLEKLEQARKKVTLDSIQAIIGGIFDTGIDEFDTGLVFCSRAFLESLFAETGITSINLKFKPGTDEQKVITRLKDRLDLEVYSWKDLYPALVSALKLEKYVMFFILMLITLVASMNMISLLFMQITQKRGDIAILKAMGVAHHTITSIFVVIGMSISSIAASIGLALAWLASWILEHYPFIQLPDAYYVSHLPAKMEWSVLVVVFASVMLLSFIATWLPARKTRNINVADVLRFEG